MKSPRSGAGALSRSACAAQLTSLSTTTGPSTYGARILAGSSSPSRKGSSGSRISRPVARSTGPAALTTARRGVAPAFFRAVAAARRSALPIRSAGARLSILSSARETAIAVGIDAFGHDAFGSDADGQGGAGAGGEGVIRPDAAAAPAARCPLAGVRDDSCFGQPAHALAHGRLGHAGGDGQLGPGQPPLPHERAQDVLVGQRAEQFWRRLGRAHGRILVRDLAWKAAASYSPSK